ncbi:TetR/AcrR family transcriptional regulator [Paraburkholderia sp.]|uniref:TetR/AcrR family transcriptional regulator n=1 Tax=Paraburkholderia sp. TaxID=1926495 RepID=UPI003C7BE608
MTRISTKSKHPIDLSTVPLGDRYVAILTNRINGSNGETKGERTYTKLKLATFACLSKANLNEVTIASITAEAKVAAGTFYIHFAGTREIILEVFREFAEVDIEPALPKPTLSSGFFVEIKKAFVQIVRGFRERRFFYRAIFQFVGQDTDASGIWLEGSKRWAEALSAFAARHGKTSLPYDLNALLGHAATASVDELMKRIYIQELYGRDFVETDANDELVAEFLAFMRYRMLLGADPDIAPRKLDVLAQEFVKP